jgi:hypothetical protein
MFETVYTYGKLGYVAKLVKNGVCIGTWISYDLSNLRDQVESWKLTNLH